MTGAVHVFVSEPPKATIARKPIDVVGPRHGGRTTEERRDWEENTFDKPAVPPRLLGAFPHRISAMKIALVGVAGVPLGKHKVKDPRLDQADKLVEADKKTYATVDVVGDADASTSDAIVSSPEGRFDLIVQDLELAETRLGRNPPAAEQGVLEKIKATLEAEGVVATAGLTAEELQLVGAHAFLTSKPVVVAEPGDVEKFDEFLPRVVSVGGYLSFLTVGGSENRAWLVRQGATAPEAGAVIHTDIQKGFIRAEIIGFADLLAAGGETQAKRANKMRLETKTYVMQDYDLVNFRFNK